MHLALLEPAWHHIGATASWLPVTSHQIKELKRNICNNFTEPLNCKNQNHHLFHHELR